jgi:hypothetical protein
MMTRALRGIYKHLQTPTNIDRTGNLRKTKRDTMTIRTIESSRNQPYLNPMFSIPY